MRCVGLLAGVALVAFCGSARAQPFVGPLPDEEVVRVIRDRVAALNVCYEIETREGTGQGGRAQVSMRIAPSGAVTSAAVELASSSARMRNCIKQRVEAWTFPPFETGPKEFSYPVMFLAK